MSKPIKVWYECKCGQEFEVNVTPVTPAQTYGPPENCYPEEGGEIEPEECEHCGCKVDSATCHEKSGDAHDQEMLDRNDRYND
jgi:hypothetical protein